MSANDRPTTRLKRLIVAEKGIAIMPVVHDPLCAKIAEQQGIKAIISAGYANSAAHLGKPDIGLMTLTEMVSCLSRIVDAVDIPVFADADTGYGDIPNVIRTVESHEKAGAAGLFIEDQTFPKRCGHMAGKMIIPTAHMVSKVKAAVDARRDQDFLIMARTDAIAVDGFDEAIHRAGAYAEAGADLLFVEGPRTTDELRRIPKLLSRPTMANMLPGGTTPIVSADALEDWGYAIVTHPTGCTYAIAKAVREYFGRLRETRTTANMEDLIVDFEEFNRIVGLDGIRAREAKYKG